MDHVPGPPPIVQKLTRLITFLTVAMIVGILAIALVITLMWFRISSSPSLPDNISLPSGETAIAVTQGTAWSGVVSKDASGAEKLHILSSDGTIARSIALD